MHVSSSRRSTHASRGAGFLAALCTLLAGCAAGPDFRQPDPQVPAQWSDTARSVSSVGSAPDAWWATFNDPQLTSLVERAAAANLDVREAALRISEARAELDLSEAGRWPQVSAGAGYQRQRVSDSTLEGEQLAAANRSGLSLPNPYGLYQLGINVSWELDLFGRVRRAVEASRAQVQVSDEDRNAMLLAMSSEVVQRYLELRGAQRAESVTQAALVTQRELLELTRERQSTGLANGLDVANAAALVSTSLAQVPALEQQVTLKINQLSLLLAREPDALRAELQLPVALQFVPPQIPLGIPADLVRRRPDIRSAEANLHVATARVGVAVADLFPHLSLGLGAGWQAQNASDLMQWVSRFASGGPQIDIPIFSGGARRANVRIEDVRAQEAALNYQRTVLIALHEVENALAGYAAEDARYKALTSAVDSNREAVELARERYQSGISSFLEVLDAERNLQQNELQLAQSATAWASNLALLYKSLGGGWQALAAGKA